MATTYLQATNELLREINEIVLTSSNFANAIGIQQHAKDCINRAYNDIVTSEPRWSFLATGESGATDPFYGNVYLETVAGTRWYELKESSSSLTTDYGAIDWNDFYLTTIGVSGASTPYTSRNLRYVTLEDWKDFRRESENIDDTDSQNWGEPSVVFRSPDGRKFGGIGFIPVVVGLFAISEMLTQSTLLNQVFNRVALKAVKLPSLEDYKKGLRQMKSNMLSPAPKYITDDRVRVV